MLAATLERAAIRARLLLPRTVRLRLTVLYGAVVFIAGASLLAITFLFGSHQAISVSNAVARGGSIIQVPGPGLLPGEGASRGVIVQHRSGGMLTIIYRKSGSASGGVASQVRMAAEFGSSIARGNLFFWGSVALAIVTLLGVALGWVMSGRMLRPLRKMTNTTQHISEQNLHERLALSGPRGDELKELGDTIDGLLARLESAFDAQGRFVQNASHELRTPIAMMRTSLDVATGKPGGVTPEVAGLASKLGEGLDQAERLLEGFLVLARVQAGAVTDERHMALREIVDEALKVRQPMIEGLAITVERTLDHASVSGSETLLNQVVANLIDNAIRHNEPGGWLRVITKTEGPTVCLIIENGGTQLDQAHVDQLGRPFQRLVADRTESDRGAGLGLSIVVAIVEAHGGKTTFSARADGGFRVTVELEVAEEFATRLRR